MKTSGKLYFGLGILATIGAMTLIYAATQDMDKPKSPEELIRRGKNLLKNAARDGKEFADESVDAIEKEAKAVVKKTKAKIEEIN